MPHLWHRIRAAVGGCDHFWIVTTTIHGWELEECPKCLRRRVGAEPRLARVAQMDER